MEKQCCPACDELVADCECEAYMFDICYYQNRDISIESDSDEWIQVQRKRRNGKKKSVNIQQCREREKKNTNNPRLCNNPEVISENKSKPNQSIVKQQTIISKP